MDKIVVGYATKLGTIGAIVGLLMPFLGELQDTTAPLGVPAEVWVKASAVLVAVTVLGRMGQAVAAYFTKPGGDQ